MARPDYIEIRVKTALNRVQGMPFRWSLNPYRGCRHGCAYCYARVTHTYFDLDPGPDFERVIFVKVNLPEVLRAELSRPGWKGERVAVGTATDPYQPAEARYLITRRCLEVFARRANPCSVTTKGTLVVRDIDLFQELARLTDFAVNVSLITLDAAVWRRLEPRTPPPASRLRAVERLAAAGIRVNIFLAPILPGLTDRPEQLAAVVRAAADHGAAGVYPGVLRLGPGVKEVFLTAVSRHFPSLRAFYEGLYGRDSMPPARYQGNLAARFARLVSRVEFRVPPPPAVPCQLPLPIQTVPVDERPPAVRV
jgi:DNA repair photolyase